MMTREFLPDVFGRGATDWFGSLQREVDQVFRDFGRGWPTMAPERRGMMPVKFNVAETDKAFEVTADMPGLDAKDIDVQIKDDVLTVRGERKEEKDEKDKNYRLVERSYGMFERSFELPVEVEGDKIEASFEKGVLKVMLPKKPSAQVKVQKIEVKAKA
jgi:HSP20 family protein